jgi:hypothetical protein
MTGQEMSIPDLQFFTEWFASAYDPSDCTNMFLHSIEPKSTWILLKSHVDSLVANFAFPQLASLESALIG